ncbi:hypothetical protein BO86DRAFT_433854 [Aspergillus japonicus CBS 114.51]|uniref:TM2 domain-containing protein n=1 Tax=Aspergillus japonicus CBS 114.51 TaxID=1448312 RepID=A0A8T8WWF3_ASPJA|nr:hypothetical protein BO86DRAFT_433854 [Aspergillus japonicus CBS 114.51]RAH80161.1 hypothetical protein BO86DRAFT_433854 [Aspergillus japonicus CBS 114.51]
MDHELEKGLRHDEEAPEIRRLDPAFKKPKSRRCEVVECICSTLLLLGIGSLVTYFILRYIYGEREARLQEECGQAHEHLQARWGGFAERPMDNKCYRQERTAILLSMFLGFFGVDQWYAHHWALAIFKMSSGLTFLLIRNIPSTVLDRTDSCLLWAFLGLTYGLFMVATPVWWLTDTILWTVGGYYGTPGCPGGSGSWRY